MSERDKVAREIIAMKIWRDDGRTMLWGDADDNEREQYRRIADQYLTALTDAGYAVVRLPESPSEYWGPEHQPQWNHYPFTRVDGDQVEIGARSEHVFRINVAEARVFAADVLAAADVAEASR
ncbi:hypothetical protein [Mycolicibacterium sp. XJ775]